MKKRISSILFACIICLSVCVKQVPIYAAGGDEFEVSITNDENNYTGNIKFKVTNETDKEVALGTGQTSEANTTFQGGLTIPETVMNGSTVYRVVGIADHAFSGNTLLTSISGNSIKKVGKNAMLRNLKLAFVNLPEVIEISDYAFQFNISLTSIELAKVNNIGDHSFSDNKNLREVYMPKAETIGEFAFANDITLTMAEFPEAITIKKAAFNNCVNLGVVDFPSIQSVGETAFALCAKLTSVNLPSATKIENNAFYGCPLLTEINLFSVTTMERSVFNLSKNIKIMVLGIMSDTAMYTYADIKEYPEFINVPSSSTITDVTFGTQKYVENGLGTIQTFDLNVIDPVSVSTNLGEEATLRVDADMNKDVPFDSLSYQWEKNNAGTWTSIANATDKELSIQVASVNNAGDYRCVITPDSYASMAKTSATATITIAPYQPDFNETTVTGIFKNEAYVRGSILEFSANGAGMGRQYPFEEDIRYEPRSWKVASEHGTLSNPYTESFDTSTFPFGETTLEINFVKQHYTNGVWSDVVTSESFKKNITFTIEKLTNSWTSEPSIAGWTYGEVAKTPAGEANVGTVIFRYSNQEHGIFTSDVPTEAGTWYMNASVRGVSDFNDLEKTVSFIIRPKDITTFMISDITKEADIMKLAIHDGSKLLVLDKDYTLQYTINDQKGFVQIVGKGNYTGVITKEFTIEKKSPETGIRSNSEVLYWSMLLSGCTLFYGYRKKKAIKK